MLVGFRYIYLYLQVIENGIFRINRGIRGFTAQPNLRLYLRKTDSEETLASQLCPICSYGRMQFDVVRCRSA